MEYYQSWIGSDSGYECILFVVFFFFSSRRRHTRLQGDWSSDVCSSDLAGERHERADGRNDGGREVRHHARAGGVERVGMRRRAEAHAAVVEALHREAGDRKSVV